MSTLHVKPGDDPMKALAAAWGVKIHVPTKEERAKELEECIREEKEKAEKIRLKGHDCENYRVAGGPPGWLCGLCGDDAAHNCERFTVFVASPGGRSVYYCDLCGEQWGGGGWAAPSDPTWEEFLARTPGEYTRRRQELTARAEEISKTLAAAKGHDCGPYSENIMWLLDEDVAVCRLCGDEVGELPL
jgi:hypothetical protein